MPYHHCFALEGRNASYDPTTAALLEASLATSDNSRNDGWLTPNHLDGEDGYTPDTAKQLVEQMLVNAGREQAVTLNIGEKYDPNFVSELNRQAQKQGLERFNIVYGVVQLSEGEAKNAADNDVTIVAADDVIDGLSNDIVTELNPIKTPALPAIPITGSMEALANEENGKDLLQQVKNTVANTGKLLLVYPSGSFSVYEVDGDGNKGKKIKGIKEKPTQADLENLAETIVARSVEMGVPPIIIGGGRFGDEFMEPLIEEIEKELEKQEVDFKKEDIVFATQEHFDADLISAVFQQGYEVFDDEGITTPDIQVLFDPIANTTHAVQHGATNGQADVSLVMTGQFNPSKHPHRVEQISNNAEKYNARILNATPAAKRYLYALNNDMDMVAANQNGLPSPQKTLDHMSSELAARLDTGADDVAPGAEPQPRVA